MVTKASGNFGASELNEEELLARLRRFDAVEVQLVESERRCAEAQRCVDRLERQNRRLEHQLQLLLKKLYGRSSEKIDPNQLLLFMAGQQAGAAEETEDESASFAVKAHVRRPNGHGRDSFPDHLPRHRIHLEPAEEERFCSECQDPLCRVTEQVSEKGEYVPGYWRVNEYVRGVWACRKGHRSVVMAPAPAGVVDKSRFEPSVYAHIATAKYGDHVPLHRQEAIFQRAGLSLSRKTMCDMMRDLAHLLSDIHQEMRSQLLASRFIQSDDTPLDVLLDREGNKGKRKKVKGRVWVYLAPGGISVFDFTLSRSRDGPDKFLRGFEGTHLQGDKYEGYDHICRKQGLIKVGCWAHVRRKFVEAQGVDLRRSSSVVWAINWLFRIERKIRDRLERDPGYAREEGRAARQRLCTRVLGRLKDRLEGYRDDPTVTPGSPLGVAVGYALNQWEDLERYLDDLEIRPDNNACERALRSVVLGRKNYLHFGSPRGGRTAAILYSMVWSCKALEIDPYAYLLDVARRRVADRHAPAEELTPWAWQKSHARHVMAEVVEERPAAT